MNGKLDSDNVALSGSDAYFSNSNLFKAYIKLVGDTEEVSGHFSVFYIYILISVVTASDMQSSQSSLDAKYCEVQKQ
jgi:hypothetical protein